MKDINTPGPAQGAIYLTLLSPPSLGNGTMVMLLLLSLRWGMKKILRAYPKDIFDISDHFISVHFQYNKEAMAILNKQNNGGVNGGVNGGDTELSKNAILVLKAMDRNGKQTLQQISNDLQIPVRSAQRASKELREKNYIKREGATKRGQYKVLKSYN